LSQSKELSIEKFKELSDDKERLENAQLIINKFVLPHSPFQLNLSGDVHAALVHTLNLI
jgi:hypothetical protein